MFGVNHWIVKALLRRDAAGIYRILAIHISSSLAAQRKCWWHMVCVCVCVKIHDIESGSRGPLLLHYTVCERHNINSMQIRTVRAVRIINHGKLASFPSFFSSIRRRFRHRSHAHGRNDFPNSSRLPIDRASTITRRVFREFGTRFEIMEEKYDGASDNPISRRPFGYNGLFIRDKFQHSEEQTWLSIVVARSTR